MKSYFKILIELMLCAFILSSCKSKILTTTGTIEHATKAQQAIKNHKKRGFQCEFLSGNIAVNIKDSKQDKGVTLSFRMQKDKAIWMSAPLGLAKIYVTPDRVQLYNKLDNTYFDGDFEYLSQLIGITLNFKSLQNLLSGQTLFSLSKDDYTYELSDTFYVFKSQNSKNPLQMLYALLPEHFQVGYFEMRDSDADRFASARYTYQQLNNQVFPSTITILVREETDEKHIVLDFKSMQCDENLHFPFKIPSGYKRISVD